MLFVFLTLLTLALLQHDMDKHFVDTNPRHNLPVLLALTDIWNDTFLRSSARVITPSTQAFAEFPSFVAALESQSCGGHAAERPKSFAAGEKGLSCASAIIDGGLESAYDRTLYQSSNVMNSEILMALDTQISFNTARSLGSQGEEDVHATQDALICSLFAHADELAFGYDRSTGDGTQSLSTQNAALEGDSSEGNRPSLLLMPAKLDAFACGQLVALSEHRAAVKAHIWGLDPFAREVGSTLRMYRTDQLKDYLQDLFAAGPKADEEDDGDSGGMNLSTKTILGHYASNARDQRLDSSNEI